MLHDPRLLAICGVLIEEIPDPYIPPPKAQKSWATLEVGRKLKSLSSGEVVTVTACDSAGVSLSHEDGSRSRLEDKEWKVGWEKVRKARKKKGEG